MRAVITAGGPIDGAYARRAGTDRKALAPVRGRTMIERTIDALHGCDLREIAVVGNDDVARVCEPLGARMIGDAGTGSGNILRALDAWPSDEPLLYLTCDMPYIDAASLQWMIEHTPSQTLAMPLTEHAQYVQRFPGAPAAGITLNRRARRQRRCVRHSRRGAEDDRGIRYRAFRSAKSAVAHGRDRRSLMLLRFAAGRASIASLEARARAVLGIAVTAVRNAPAELAFDADGESEYEYALAHD